MKAQKPSLKPLCAPPKPGQQLKAPSVEGESPAPASPMGPSLSGVFLSVWRVQRAAPSSPHTRHLQTAQLGRWEAPGGGSWSRFPARPSPIQERTSRASCAAFGKGGSRGGPGEGVGHTTRVCHAGNLPTCQFTRVKLEISRNNFSVITINTRGKSCLGGEIKSVLAVLHCLLPPGFMLAM